MNKRLVGLGGATLALAATAAILAGDGRGSESTSAQTQPNVVVIMTDDQTVESLRVMTNVRNLLAAQGTTFANNFATFSLCCPSRATYLTGQYAHTNGIMGNAPPEGGYDKLEPTHRNTLPNWLRVAGYHTVHIGKYLNGYTADDGIPKGWSEWYGSVDPSTYRFYGYTLRENNRFVTYGNDPADYQTDVYTRKAVGAIARLAPGKPFFLSVAYLAPHSGGPQEPGDPVTIPTPVPAPRHVNTFDNEPLPAPPSFNEADVSDKPSFIARRPLLTDAEIADITESYQQRLESLLAVDEGVAAIVSALASSGELANTLLVFTADNGFFHGEHRVRTGKVLLYEPSVRTPLILRGPGITRGLVLPNLVGNIDLAPTIVDAAEARAGRAMDGRSLLPLIANPGLPWRDEIVLENARSTGLRTERYMYATHDTGEEELYDLLTDPDQLTNLTPNPAFAGTRSQLAHRLGTLIGRCAAEAPCLEQPGDRVGLVLRLASKRGLGNCARFPVRASVEGSRSAVARVSWVQFVAGSRVLAIDRNAPFVQSLGPGLLDRRSGTLVQARVVLTNGRVTILSASVPACRRS